MVPSRSTSLSTYAGGGRGNRGTKSGQGCAPVTHQSKYGLHFPQNTNSFTYWKSNGQQVYVYNEQLRVTDGRYGLQSTFTTC